MAATFILITMTVFKITLEDNTHPKDISDINNNPKQKSFKQLIKEIVNQYGSGD